MFKNIGLRDLILTACLVIAPIVVFMNPVYKDAPNEKMNIANMVPIAFAGWQGITYDVDINKKSYDFLNELVVRVYVKREPGLLRVTEKAVNFVFEYGSDLRKNFSLHFPEICQKQAGNDVEYFNPIEIKLTPEKSIMGKCMFIKGKEGSFERTNTLVVYWLMIDNKQYYKTFDIKLDQMLSGLLMRSKKGFLIRFNTVEPIEYSDESISEAKGLISDFVRDLYVSLDPASRDIIFGK